MKVTFYRANFGKCFQVENRNTKKKIENMLKTSTKGQRETPRNSLC